MERNRLVALSTSALGFLAGSGGAATDDLLAACGEAKLVADDAAALEYFGFDVDASGDTLLIGVPGSQPAEAHVYVRRSGAWYEQARLTSGGAAWHDFAWSVAVSGDTALVGAQGFGVVYVFSRNGTTWTQQATLQPSPPPSDDGFGGSIDVDGDFAVVGAVGEDGGAGAAYVFVRSGTGWAQQARLTAHDAAPGNLFGVSVSISRDTVLVGSDCADSTGRDAGSAYVFIRNGDQWSQQAQLKATDSAPGDRFGFAVSIHGDTALVGALNNADAGPNTGSAYVFARTGTHWAPPFKLLASDAGAGDSFGAHVSVAGDVAVIAAQGDDDAGRHTGSAYVFLRSGREWVEEAKLVASDAAAYDEFASALSISGDTVVCGSKGDHEAGSWTGSAYVFTLKPIAGASFCACPAGICGNSDLEAGCANSTGVGAFLVGHGTTAPDTVDLSVAGAVPFQPGLFFEGLGALGGGSGIPFGDGLRCAGPQVVRVAIRASDGTGHVGYGPCLGDAPLSSVTGAPPGASRTYQYWYRDAAGPCGSSFNLSSGFEITW